MPAVHAGESVLRKKIQEGNKHIARPPIENHSLDLEERRHDSKEGMADHPCVAATLPANKDGRDSDIDMGVRVKSVSAQHDADQPVCVLGAPNKAPVARLGVGRRYRFA